MSHLNVMNLKNNRDITPECPWLRIKYKYDFDDTERILKFIQLCIQHNVFEVDAKALQHRLQSESYNLSASLYVHEHSLC